MYKKIVLFTTLFSSALLATTFEPLEVVSAHDATLKLEHTTENITVITAKQLEESHVTTLADALTQFANIAYTSNGTYGQAASFYLRGMDSKHILVLVDGVRINDVTGLNGAQFEHLILGDVAQIEIIKGAQSGIWGADASSGVINIITKAAQKGTHASIRQSTGSFNTQQSSATLSHKNDRVALKFSATSLSSAGISAAESKKGTVNYGTRGYEGNYTLDPYINTSYAADAVVTLSQYDTLALSATSIHSVTQYDGGAGVDGKNISNLQNRFYSAKFEHKDTLNEAKIAYNYSQFERDYGVGNDYTGFLEEVRASEQLSYGDESFLMLGGNYQKHTHNKSYGSDLNKSLEIQSAFLTNYNRWSDTIFSQTVRYDAFSTDQSAVTGKVGFKQLIDTAFLALNYGSGYNVPTISALYGQWGANANLKPESTIGGDVTVGNEHVELTYFYNEITDLIVYTSAYENSAGISTFEGVEAKVRYEIKDIAAFAFDYTSLRAKDAKGQWLARRPQNTARLHVSNFWTSLFSTLTQLEYVGTRYDSLDRSGAQTGEYLLVHLTANYKQEGYALFAQVSNLLDRFYQTVDGYGTMGRNFKVGLSAQF